MYLKYIPRKIKSRGFNRFAIIVTIGIALAFAVILTVAAAGEYQKRPPITATPWLVLCSLAVFLVVIQCSQTMSVCNNIL